MFGDECLEHFTFDVIGEAALDQRNRGFSRTETGDASDLRKILGYFLGSFGYFFRRDFQIQFFPASYFRHFEFSLLQIQSQSKPDNHGNHARYTNCSSYPAPFAEISGFTLW